MVHRLLWLCAVAVTRCATKEPMSQTDKTIHSPAALTQHSAPSQAPQSRRPVGAHGHEHTGRPSFWHGAGGAPDIAARVLNHWSTPAALGAGTPSPFVPGRADAAALGQPASSGAPGGASPAQNGGDAAAWQASLQTAEPLQTGLALDEFSEAGFAREWPSDGSPFLPSGQGSAVQQLLLPMSQLFGLELRDVRLTPAGDDGLVRAGQAVATRDEVRYDPARLDPSSRSGLQLLGHELAHVVQQRRGQQQADRVDAGLAAPTGEFPDAASTDEDSARRRQLETEADEAGQRIADGQAAHVASAAQTPLRQFKETVDVLSWPQALRSSETSAATKQAICTQIADNRTKVDVSMLRSAKNGYFYGGKDLAKPKKKMALENKKDRTDAERVMLIIAKELEKEGGYSSINSYDNQKFTWGRGFSALGDLPKVLKTVFADAKLSATFLSHGIRYTTQFEIVDTQNQSIVTGADALNELSKNQSLLGVFVHVAEDTSAEPGSDSPAQKVADAQWDQLEAGPFRAPDFVHAWKDDRLVAFVAHLVHWLPKVPWSRYAAVTDIAGALDTWLQHIGTVGGITHKAGCGAVVISDSARKNLMEAFGSRIAGEYITSICQYPIPYTKEQLNTESALSGKYLFSKGETPGKDGYYVYPDMPKINGKDGKEQNDETSQSSIYHYFHTLNQLSMPDVLAKLGQRSSAERSDLLARYTFDPTLGTRCRAALRTLALQPTSEADLIDVAADPDFAALSADEQQHLLGLMKKKLPKPKKPPASPGSKRQ